MGNPIEPGFGLVVLDDQLTPEILTPHGAGVFDSAYTQAGPLPGHPVPDDPSSRWRPQIAGAQSRDLSAATIHGGFPGRDGAAVLYREALESTAEDYRGWCEPVLVTRWTAPPSGWSTAAAFTGFAAAVIPESQTIVVTACDPALNAQTWSYDLRTETWTELYDWDAGALDGLERPIGMAWDPEGERLLLWSGTGAAGSQGQRAYQSTDGGATWSLHGRGHFDGNVSTADGIFHIAPAVGLDWLAIVVDDDDGTGIGTQWASSDRGVTWDRIDTGGLFGEQHSLARTLSGWVVAYLAPTTDRPSVRLLGSARAAFNDAAAIELDTTAVGSIWVTTDADGTVYVYANGTSGAATRDEIRCWRSVDGGATWIEYTWRAMGGADAVYPLWHVALAAGGQLHLIGTQVGDTDVDGTVHLVSFGGWGQVENGAGEAGYARDPRERFGYGTYTGTGVFGSDALLWLPYHFPESMGWALITSTGTRDLTPASEQGLELAVSGGQAEVYDAGSSATTDYAACEAIVKVVSGPDTADIGIANVGPLLALTVGDGTNTYRVTVDLCADGLQVRDNPTVGAAVIRATDNTVVTSDFFHIRIVASIAGVATVWYRALGGGTAWKVIADGVTLTSSASAGASSLLWGQQVVWPSTLIWRMVGFCSSGDWLSGVDGIGAVGNTSADGLRGLSWGKSLPGAGAAYPVPDATADSEAWGYISARGGPTFLSEMVSLPADHVHSIRHIHPDRSPSPRSVWRSTDDSEVRAVWDLTDRRWPGGAIALVALHAFPRQFVLEIDDNAGGWTTLGTLDKGWGGINYTRSGGVVVPRTGTATIDRYLHEGELVGSYMVVSTGAGDVARRIARQSAGYFTTDPTVQRVVIELEGIDGTEDVAGTGQIVHHSGLLVVYPTMSMARRYLRVRIAAGAVTPDGVYQAGVLGIGRVVGVGAEPSWDWSVRTELSREVTRRRDGQLEVRRTGPPRRVIEYAWPDGLWLRELRTLAADADYVAKAAGMPIATEEDVSTSLLGVIVERLRSGEVPAVVVPRLPSADATITDPTLYLYGRLLSDSQGVTGVLGTEGQDELVRFDSAAFEELT